MVGYNFPIMNSIKFWIIASSRRVIENFFDYAAEVTAV
jgi:hypothetical protein